MKRDRFRCTYCGAPGTDAELEIDHIIAVARGGSHHISNLTTACRACNQAKGAGDLPKKLARGGGPVGTGVVGLWLWTLEAAPEQTNYLGGGVVRPGWRRKWQGSVIGMHDAMALVQLYSYLDGSPTNVVAIPVDELFSERCVLFRDNEVFLHFSERVDRDEMKRLRVVQ